MWIISAVADHISNLWEIQIKDLLLLICECNIRCCDKSHVSVCMDQMLYRTPRSEIAQWCSAYLNDYTHTHTHIHTYMHAYIHTYVRIYKIYIDVLIQQYIHTYVRTYIDTYIHIHTYIQHTYNIHVSVAEWLAWLTSNCGRIGAIGSSPSNGLRPNM